METLVAHADPSAWMHVHAHVGTHAASCRGRRGLA